MNYAFRLKMAKQKAETVLRERGHSDMPVDPIAIAEASDIVVRPKPDCDPGVSGMLLRHGDAFGILYATHIASIGFQRFSIAHELGHYFLDGHMDHVLPHDGVHASQAGFVSVDPFELEADQFAAGLLMPSTPFRRALGRHRPGLSAIEALAERCGTSLTATAIRYAELTDDAVAVVVSTGQAIDFCRLSDTMKSLYQITWPRRGSPLPAGSATAALNRSVARVLRADRVDADIDIAEWLGGARSADATEEAVGLGDYRKTLTVLVCPSLIEEAYQDEDDEDGGADESWTPRFRK